MKVTDAEKREAVKAAFAGRAWKLKVSKMSDAQITAVYLNLKSQSKI
jgi:hypothetical protein